MNRVIKTILFFILTIVYIVPLYAQNPENESETVFSADGKGWVFGLNVGVYYASKNTAPYYNGNTKNENNINYVMSNYYWYQEIFYALRAHDSILVSGLPENMHYKLALQPGLYAQYCFNPTWSLVFEFTYMKLKAEDAIVFEVDPKPYATEPDLRLYPIRGAEERIYADIGLKRSFPKDDNLSYFIISGINVNSTQVKKSSIYIEEKEYSIINTYGNNAYVPNGNNQSFSVYQGGIGVGMHIGGGASLTFGNGMVLEPGIKAHWLMVNLNQYKNMNPGIGAYVRFLF